MSVSEEMHPEAKEIITTINSMGTQLGQFIDALDVMDLSLAKRSRFRDIFDKVYECKQSIPSKKPACVVKQLTSQCRQENQKVNLQQRPTVDTLLYIYCLKKGFNEVRMATVLDL